MHHVPILDNIVFAFQSQSALGTGVRFGSSFQQLVPANGFRADEVLFQVGVNGACAVLGAGIRGNGPGPAFVFSCGEERDQSQQVLALADQARKAAVGQSIAA